MASQEITDKLTVFYNAVNAIFFLHVVKICSYMLKHYNKKNQTAVSVHKDTMQTYNTWMLVLLYLLLWTLTEEQDNILGQSQEGSEEKKK